jgi:hypothetical protein
LKSLVVALTVTVALDLLFRKIVKDQGATLTWLADLIRETVKAGGTGDPFEHERTLVGAALDDAQQHLGVLLTHAMASLDEARREEMMDELVTLLSTDTVFKQVGVGLLASIAASEYRGDPTDLCTIRFWDRTQPDASKPQVDYDGGFYSSANSMNDAAQLIQAGSASAFELFQRWAPRAQPVYENTSPSFEVTAEEVDVDLVDTPTDDVTDGGRLLHRR